MSSFSDRVMLELFLVLTIFGVVLLPLSMGSPYSDVPLQRLYIIQVYVKLPDDLAYRPISAYLQLEPTFYGTDGAQVAAENIGGSVTINQDPACLEMLLIGVHVPLQIHIGVKQLRQNDILLKPLTISINIVGEQHESFTLENVRVGQFVDPVIDLGRP